MVVDREKARCGAWYEMFPRSCAAESGAHGTFKDGERRFPMSPPWASTFSICRRFIRSGTPVPQRQKQCSGDGPANDPAAPGRSALKRAATRPFIRGSGRWRISTASSRQAKNHWISKSLWISLFSAPRIIRMSKNIRNGFADVRMAPSNTPRTRPKKYQDIYPFDFEIRGLAGALAGAEERRRYSGASRACGSFASITRTPRRFRSGSGSSREVEERIIPT